METIDEKPVHTIISIGPYAWGKAPTVSESRKFCKLNIPWVYVTGEYIEIKSFYCHPDTAVNDMGGFVHPVGHPPVLVDEVRLKRPRRY